MKISELAEETGVPVATLKYYLREGVLHPGRALNRTQADYGDDHVERVRLVRALTGVGGLSIAAVRRVLDVISEPGLSRVDVMAAAQRSILGADFVEIEDEGGELAGSPARDFLGGLGWVVHNDDPVLDELDRAWEACDDVGLGLDVARMETYASAMLDVARVDVASVPDDPSAAVRQVVLGTPLVDAVLIPLRRLAQQHVAKGEGPR